jgi:hypothetical protein
LPKRIGLLKDLEKKLAPAPEPWAEVRPLTHADAAIVEGLVARLRRMLRAELAGAAT